MLIATAITLLMMAAVVNLFANLSGSIRNRRAVIELSSQIRQVRQRLARDLAGCTVPVQPAGLVPWQRSGAGIGYFEIVEGGRSDANPSDLLDDINPEDGYADGIDENTSLIPTDNAGRMIQRDLNTGNITSKVNGLGDFDDILALTVQDEAQPFTGLCQAPNPTKSGETGFPDPTNNDHWIVVPIESHRAEVVWYAGENPADGSLGEPGMRRIYRRALPIAPEVPNVNAMRGYNVSLSTFQQYNDLSVRRDISSGNIEPNSLADLTRREYRYGRGGGSAFPFPFEYNRLSNDPKYLVLNDALAFDVRVYDPGAPVYSVSGGVLVGPNDPAWLLAVAGPLKSTATLSTFGAYVDLGWNDVGTYNYATLPPALGAPAPLFQQQRRAGWHPAITDRSLRGTPAVYDTWSWHYEVDGVDQDLLLQGPPTNYAWPAALNWRTTIIDQGSNQRDDDGINGVDDVLERETSPPYPVPLRGIKVIFRTYERDARQVREASVTHSFVP